MNKQLLHDAIINALQAVHQGAVDAALQAHDTATNKETVAENKYDTFGLEASYLAHGQAKRVAEYEADLAAFEGLVATEFYADSSIAIGALIHLEDIAGVGQWLFLSPAAGGLKLCFDYKHITLITVSSPLGTALIGCSVGDEVELKIAARNKTYEIMAIY